MTRLTLRRSDLTASLLLLAALPLLEAAPAGAHGDVIREEEALPPPPDGRQQAFAQP